MPSLQIKDYIIAGLLLALLLAGITIGYDKTRMSIMATQLDNVKLVAEEAERKTKLIEKRAEQERTEANEQYQSDITALNVELKRMRDSSASLLPAITKAARYTDQIAFQRSELDRAIQQFRAEIQGLVAKGAECEIEIKTLQNWWYNVRSLYGDQ
ncbi:MAG: hypothetical protein K2Q45_00040 [Nitrosomonas sp.]|nr:hypothetical protein [Nitrosomonas sp.]